MNFVTQSTCLKQLGARLVACCAWALLLGPFAVTLWIWADVRGVPLYVLSGALFRSSWWIGHAGFCLDQPTIGKWYFWTTLFSGAWSVAALAAWRASRGLRPSVRRAYAAACAVVAAFYLCLLTLPFTWTVQYLCALGFTQRRLIALAWGLSGYAILSGLAAFFARRAWQAKPARANEKLNPAPKENRCTP
jgi:hypothetical protein